MGWFDEQIEYRKKHEREMLADNFDRLEYAVTGRRSSGVFQEGADVSDALESLRKYFGIKDREIPAKLRDLESQMDFLLTSSDIMYREVVLEPGWHRDAMGVMITSLEESGAVIAVLRNAAGQFVYRDPATGRQVRVTAAEEKKIGKEAYCFYKPLPLQKLKTRDLFRYMAETLTGWDIASFAIAALAITVVGMFMPKLNHILMDEVISSGSYRLLAAVMSFMFFSKFYLLVKPAHIILLSGSCFPASCLF